MWAEKRDVCGSRMVIFAGRYTYSVCDMAVRTVLISRHFDVLGAFNEEVGLIPSD